MVYVGNLILRTMVLEYFNNSLHFKRYGRLFSKIVFCTMVQKSSKIISVQNPGIGTSKKLVPGITIDFLLKKNTGNTWH